MIGIVIVAHTNIAQEMLRAVEHVVGPQKDMRAIGIEAHDDIDLLRDQIASDAKEVDTGDGTLILTDMFGGTPSNLAIAAMARANVEVITGLNLPMLVKAATCRECSLGEITQKSVDAGRKYINAASVILNNDKND